jgi:hypothetical protein
MNEAVLRKNEERTSRRLLKAMFVMQPTEDRCRNETRAFRKPRLP